uniref:Peptidase_M14 domain-containing protein n=1 Tax=Syphacia muris TaxID=451379 RepID=A0A0N5B0H4_9BILA
MLVRLRQVLLLASILVLAVDQCFGINWNSDIVASEAEEVAAHNDRLWMYFKKQLEDDTLFQSQEQMTNIVGSFKDVDTNRIRNHNYTEMTDWLNEYANKYPNITMLYSVGKSVQNRDLWVIVISQNPRTHSTGIPEFKYVGNIHGNEVVGRETLLYLIAILCENYGHNRFLTEMVNTTRIHIMPSMNPDGYEAGVRGDHMGYMGRSNANQVDLNRNFPPRYIAHEEDDGAPIQPETKAAMQWMQDYPFILSASLHGGSLVANYPYDDSDSGRDGIYTETTDDKLFVGLAYTYARAHRNMWKTGRRCGLNFDGDTFLNGITNGAEWYHLAGGMQDWQYLHTNSFEVTIEMGCFKYPTDDLLPALWDDHKYALLAFLNLVHKGVVGYVLDEKGNPVKDAVISVNPGKNITTTTDGEFWRLLFPGTYNLTVSCTNHETTTVTVTVTDGPAEHLNITLPRKYCKPGEYGEHIRGNGTIRIAVVGLDDFGRLVIGSMANETCAPNTLFTLTFRSATLTLLPKYDNNTLKFLKHQYYNAILTLRKGHPSSMVYSSVGNTPKSFDKQQFDNSLQKVFQEDATFCVDEIPKTKVLNIIKKIVEDKMFVIDIPVGCSAFSLNKYMAALAAVLQTVAGFYTTPNGNIPPLPALSPSNLFPDHLPPSELVKTTFNIGHIKQEHCGIEVDINQVKTIVMGAEVGPAVLIMAAEERTEVMLYQMITSFCDSRRTNPVVHQLFKTSTIIVALSALNSSGDCYDYPDILPFEQTITTVVTKYPLVDVALILGTGGMRVRYIDVSRRGLAKSLAFAYANKHAIMNVEMPEMCSKSEKRPTVDVGKWSGEFIKFPDVILVQTACCYGQRDPAYLFSENSASITEVLQRKLTGVMGKVLSRSGTPVMAPVIVHVEDLSTEFTSVADGFYFVNLPKGTHKIIIRKENYHPVVFHVTVTESLTSVRDVVLLKTFTISSFIIGGNFRFALLILIIVFASAYCVYRLYWRRGVAAGRPWEEGFKMLPQDDDFSDSDDVDDLKLITSR